jgi:NTP pyrophosphatase (non-canonical NTP hydrolase)
MKEHIYYAKYSETDIDLLCKRALKEWGIDTQILMAIEELSELIQVLAKSRRKINGSDREEIAQEIADVDLMIKQMQVAFKINNITIASIEEEKLDRLKHYLEEATKNERTI